jgi:hypothetical protein
MPYALLVLADSEVTLLAYGVLRPHRSASADGKEPPVLW